MGEYHLAQANIGLPRAPLDSAEMAGFMAALAPINHLADHSPGFVWRLQTPEGDATSVRVFEDERIIINMSVWRSLAELWDFVYASRHLDVMRRRREWFHRMEEAYLVLWWVPAGHLPTPGEASQRLELLRRNGPGPDAFTFRQPFPPPHEPAPALAYETGAPRRLR